MSSTAHPGAGIHRADMQDTPSSEVDAQTPKSGQKLSRFALTGMVAGSMLGGGIFSLPSTFAHATGPFGAIIAWMIAASGMYTLARVFQVLALRKPNLNAGVYAYAKAGFGDYPGFLSAFGYWMQGCLTNVAYWVLINSTLGALFPAFGVGSTVTGIVVASVGIWLFHFTILKGIQQATFINFVATVAKIVPILVFIVLLIGAFQADLFRANFFGGPMLNSSLFAQVRATMLVTVFVFIGIEGASVYSRYARTREDVGAATLLGFLGVTCLLVLVTLLPYAVLPSAQIAQMHQPSMAGVLEAVVGRWGAVFVSIGLLISVLGAYLAWSLMSAEVLFNAANTKDMPRIFAGENRNNVPAAALWATNVVVQLLLISTYWSQNAFSLMLEMTSSMALIPYLLVAGYGRVVARRGEGYSPDSRQRTRDATIATIAIGYTAFMIYAGGLKYLLLSAVLYAPGTLLYCWARREQGQRTFKPFEWIIFCVAVAGCVAGIWAIATGRITV